jgi:hypothetical protein
LIPTTDIRDTEGWVSKPSPAGDYALFFGTSAATPHVAGLAALLISANKSLSNVEVQTIIERTCDKVNLTTYSYGLVAANGTWNEEMGYGRINAYEAVKAALRTAEIRGPIFRPKVESDKSEVFDSKPEFERPFDIRIFEHILERLERLERHTGVGQPFITRSERPNVGGNITRRVSEKK